jgi:hypothetical protein
MMVVTRFGPRFEPLGQRKRASGIRMDTMKLDGAVYAGKPTRVIVARNREIVGQVVDYKGSPLAGIPITLSDTMYGHMSGYPLTELDATRTDASGNYRFARLPNCRFTISALPKVPAHVETLSAKGRWEFLSVDRGQGLSGYIGVIVQADGAISRCDFRVSKPTEGTVLIEQVSGASFKG